MKFECVGQNPRVTHIATSEAIAKWLSNEMPRCRQSDDRSARLTPIEVLPIGQSKSYEWLINRYPHDYRPESRYLL